VIRVLTNSTEYINIATTHKTYRNSIEYEKQSKRALKIVEREDKDCICIM